MTSEHWLFCVSGAERRAGLQRTEGGQGGGRVTRTSGDPWKTRTCGAFPWIKLPSSCFGPINNHQLVAVSFRDPKENQCWVHRDHLGCQVHQAHRALAKQDQLALLDHRGLQDLLPDMVQVFFIRIASAH